ncbi:flavodoxin [Treponema sp.]|uniref:flavodoxin n=1 Tax=Treponema sp. TaxID=166 RepID=UPI00298E620A|nr:flavodoxin [Treponema sp.]MCR5612072.1 flavodoxin [Treponema sp.]
MKKVLLTILFGALIAGSICADTKKQAAATTVQNNSTSKIAVVYFSITGNTERMAKKAASAFGADIFKIEPVHKYTSSDLNWRNKKSLTTIENNDDTARPAIANKIDLSSYDTVILCYPIWYTKAPKIIYTFVESQNWNGKKLVTLCTSGSSGLGNTGITLSKLAPGVVYKGGKDFSRGTAEEIKKYVEGILSNE